MLAVASAAGVAEAQSVSIPLQYMQVNQGGSDYYRLAINVGINGGAAKPYVFDTGSSLFNAAYSPQWWNGFSAGVVNQGVPASASLPQNLRYTYGDGGGYVGNVVQMPLLSFYAPGAATAAASLSASPGYQMNAVYQHNLPGGGSQTFPGYFSTSSTPPVEGTFYGTFGAGNFASSNLSAGGYVQGSILGQTVVPGAAAQGYVVSANGQSNPANVAGKPVQNTPTSGNQIVSVGGQSQVVTSCSPCVTVGLTPQIMGQFLPVGLPGSTPSRVGAIPVLPGNNFPNPYGTGAPNPGSTEFGARVQAMLNGTTVTTGALFDSGTPTLGINSGLAGTGGDTLTVIGTNQQGQVVMGLPSSSAILTNGITGVPNTYNGLFTYTNTVMGISFFMQNSVMFDLTDGLVSYTPYFVTVDPLMTTANGSLIIGSGNVPLGLAGAISGPGGLVVQGGGNVQLSATNTYTGPTTIMSSGKLLVSGPGSIAQSSGVTVASNGIFDISRAWAPVSIQSLTGSGNVFLGGQSLVITNASGTFSGTMSDTGGSFSVAGGGLTLTGGSLNFAGTGSFAGGTVVSGGAFQLSGSLSGGLSVGPGGSFTISAGGSLNNTGGTALNMGLLAVGGTMLGDLLNAGAASNTGTISGNVLNTGTFANNGVVNGSLFNYGTAAGSGTQAGNVMNFGTMAPGNSIGTMSITGNFTNASSGIYSAEVNGAGQSDLISVGGTANLQGGVVSVYAQPGSSFGPRTTYRILNAAGGLTGTFASVNELYPFLLSSLSYDANNAYLTLQIGGFAAAAATPTQATVGAVLDANVNTASGDFANVLSSMAVNTFSNAQAQATLQAISGNNYAGFSTSMVQGMQLFMNNFANQTGGGGSPMSNRVALAEACDVACDTTSPPKWGAWGGALGGLGTVGAGQPAGTVTYNAGGFAAGLDRLVTDTFRMGVTAGYSTGTQWVGGFDGLGRSNTFQVGLYGGFAQDKLYADGLIGYAHTQNQMWRNIAIPGLQQRTAYGNTGANQWYGQLETGYRFDIGTNANAFVTPFARLQAYTANQNAFTETGAQSLNLSIAQQQTNSLRSVLGAQLGGSMDLGWRERLAMQLRLGWSHEYADVGRPVTATLAGAPAMPFTTWGISPQRDGVVIGLSANTAIAEATSIYLRYEGDISAQDSAHAITAGVRMTW
ncbi:MAG: autotransporter domain-containing protein [Reyranella sp.]|nr:autotransporter domain-containing protein [Reyranella sp.]